MPARLTGSTPSVASAGNDLVTALGDLAAAIGRWLAAQPAAQEVPVYAERAREASAETLEHAGDWAGATATRTKEAASGAASTAKTGLINVLIVVVLLWWVNRVLTRSNKD